MKTTQQHVKVIRNPHKIRPIRKFYNGINISSQPDQVSVFYLEQVDDQRASVTQVVHYLEVIDVTVH